MLLHALQITKVIKTTCSCLYIIIIFFIIILIAIILFSIHPFFKTIVLCRVTGILERILESQLGNTPDGRTVHHSLFYYSLLFYLPLFLHSHSHPHYTSKH